MPVFLASNVLDLLLKCRWMRYEHALQERSKGQQADPAVRHASFGFRFCHGTSSGGNSAYSFLKRCANIYLPKSLRKLSEVAWVKRLAKGWICNRCSIHVSQCISNCKLWNQCYCSPSGHWNGMEWNKSECIVLNKGEICIKHLCVLGSQYKMHLLPWVTIKIFESPYIAPFSLMHFQLI